MHQDSSKQAPSSSAPGFDIAKLPGGGFLGVRPQGMEGGLVYAPDRDLANLLLLFGKGATVVLSTLYDGDAARLEVLDTIAKFTIKAFKDCLVDNAEGLLVLNELLAYIKDTDRSNEIAPPAIRQEVFGAFCALYMINTYVWLFSSKRRVIASLQDLRGLFEFTTLETLVTLLPDGIRQAAIQSLIPVTGPQNSAALVPLMQQVTNYVDTVKQRQADDYAKAARRKDG